LGLDPFGSVSSGTLQITTLIKSYDIYHGTNPWNTLVEGRGSSQIFLDDESSQSHSGVVFALLLSGSDGTNQSSFGLILQKSHLDTFHRIGIFHTWEADVMNSFRPETLTVV
jgi:hypothetical protein